MVKDQEIKDAREAHRRALAAPRRAARSEDPDTLLLRQHRSVHHNNISHDEECEKWTVPKGELEIQKTWEGGVND